MVFFVVLVCAALAYGEGRRSGRWVDAAVLAAVLALVAASEVAGWP